MHKLQQGAAQALPAATTCFICVSYFVWLTECMQNKTTLLHESEWILLVHLSIGSAYQETQIKNHCI